MSFKKTANILIFSAFSTFSIAKAESVLVLNHPGENAANTQVMTINYTSVYPDFQQIADDVELYIAVNPTNQVCLYPTYASGVCSGTPVCTTAADTHHTGFNLSSPSSAFSAGVTVSGLNHLAAQDAGVATYHCLTVNLDYSTSPTAELTTTSSNITCQVASASGSFIGGTTSNPCSASGGSVSFDVNPGRR